MLHVGTSGWQYRHWDGRFYPPLRSGADRLAYYAGAFATVEVNNTFYRLPETGTFSAWSGQVPDDFVFAVKASRYLTHMRRLRDPAEPVERLLDRAAGLGRKLGVVLLQLPPDLRAEPERLDATLAAFGGRVRVAVEPRHPSWWCPEVRRVLEARSAALCLADRGSRPVTPLWVTTDWAYLRLHSGRGRPESCYGAHALRSWAERLRSLFGTRADGYVYFNNDANGCALVNAATFARAASAAGLPVGRVSRPAQGASSRTTARGSLSVRTPRSVG